MKKNIQLTLWLFGVIYMLPISSLAHTGVTGTRGFGSGFGHPVGGADHLLAMLAIGLWAAQLGGKAIWAVPGAFVAVMVFGGGLAIAGVGLPYVEQVILLSVLALGALIAAAFKMPLSASAVIVGIFALFHGHAHAAEMPLASGAVSYSLGFASATILLHAAGIAGGFALQKLNIEKAIRLAGGAIVLCGVYLTIA